MKQLLAKHQQLCQDIVFRVCFYVFRGQSLFLRIQRTKFVSVYSGDNFIFVSSVSSEDQADFCVFRGQSLFLCIQGTMTVYVYSKD